MHPAPASVCPCGQKDARGRALAWAACCGRYVDNWATPAPTAEALMRSRYSAFVCERADYLLATWHAHTRPAALDFDAGAKWLGLQVRATQSAGAATGVHAAEVEFIARFRLQGRAVRLHERSRFVREQADGITRWFYVQGEQL